jgi:hypothetical protein
MKKFLAILTALLFVFASVLMAAPAKKAEAAPSGDMPKITTMVKEASQADYPSLLTPGSVIGTYTFVADLPMLANTALFDYLDSEPSGSLILKTDIGVVGLSSMLTPETDLDNVPVALPDNVLGLWYATNINSLPVGAALFYGNNTHYYKNQDTYYNSVPVDLEDEFSQYLGVKLGASIKDMNLDLGLGVSSELEDNKYTDMDWTDWVYDDRVKNSKMLVDLTARLGLGNGLSTVAQLAWLNGSAEYYYLDGGTDTIDKYTNSTLMLNLLLGKEFKNGTLLVKAATGLSIGGDTNGRYEFIDNLDPANNTFGSSYWQYGYINIPLNVAVEGKLNETWGVNAGAGASIVAFSNYIERYNSASGYTVEKWRDSYYTDDLTVGSSLDFAVGATGKIGDLTLDLFLNPAIFITGPYAISGQSAGNMNSGVSLRYDWI